MTATDPRLALVIANAEYEDEGLAGLVSPALDASGLARVLADPATCGFAVSTMIDSRSDEVGRAVEDFVAERDRGDLLLLYFSCHGLKEEYGRLYFAARNTVRNRLRSTAVPAGFVNDLLLGCRSRRKVLVLDCCYSGAFAKGMQVKADPSVHTAEQFDARGLVVLTASDATQYAFEGDTVRGDGVRSVFTSSLVEGLETGTADVDGDGLVSVDDAYEYVRRRMAQEPRYQSPRKWEFDVQGRIVIARSARAEPAARATARPPVSLPPLATIPPPARGSAIARAIPVVGQPRWWAGVLLFFVTATLLSWLTTAWLIDWIYGWVPTRYLPPQRLYRTAAVLAAWAWTIVYAAADAYQHSRHPTPSHWYDLTLAWLRNLATVGRPSGWRPFLRAALAAVPANIVAALTLSSAPTAAAYTYLGSTIRDQVFPPVFAVISALMLAGYTRLDLRRR